MDSDRVVVSHDTFVKTGGVAAYQAQLLQGQVLLVEFAPRCHATIMMDEAHPEYLFTGFRQDGDSVIDYSGRYTLAETERLLREFSGRVIVTAGEKTFHAR